MARSFSKLAGLAALTLALQGCAYNLRGTPEENAWLRNKNDAVLDSFFVPSVAQELKKIPVHYALFEHNQMIGGSMLSSIRAMLDGVGYEPITVYNIEKKGKIKGQVLLHENIHHAQEKGLLFREEFYAAWENMQKTKEGLYVCKNINTLIYLKYGFLSKEEDIIDERIAFMPDSILKHPDFVSEQMKQLYVRILQPWTLSNEPFDPKYGNLLKE